MVHSPIYSVFNVKKLQNRGFMDSNPGSFANNKHLQPLDQDNCLMNV